MRAAVTITVFFLLFGQFSISAGGLSVRSRDDSEMRNVILCMDLHRDQFGSLPSSWDELRRIKIGFDTLGVRVTERYAFLEGNNRPTDAYHGGEIILIARRPFQEIEKSKIVIAPGWSFVSKKLGPSSRYGISINPDGSLYIFALSELQTQWLFRDQQKVLPTVDTLPEREWVTKEKREIALTKAVAMGVILFGGFGAWIVFRRRFLTKRPS